MANYETVNNSTQIMLGHPQSTFRTLMGDRNVQQGVQSRLDSHIAWALECPLPQTQLQESRVLNYLKSVTGCDTQNEDTRDGQLDLVQQMRDIRKPWPIVERSWLDGREQDIASLSSNVQNLELVADLWKDHYDSLALEHNREEFEMELQARRLMEQLQEERLKSYNCETNVLNLENMVKKTRLETEACGNQP